MYCMSLSWIPKGILEANHRVCFIFLWSGKKDTQVAPWVRWEIIFVPKGMGAGALRIYSFLLKPCSKGGWRLINLVSLQTQVFSQKYLEPDSIEYWSRNPRKSHAGGSMIWKVVVKYFQIMESNLVSNVGSGRRLKVGEGLWMGNVQQHLLPGAYD